MRKSDSNTPAHRRKVHGLSKTYGFKEGSELNFRNVLISKYVSLKDLCSYSLFLLKCQCVEMDIKWSLSEWASLMDQCRSCKIVSSLWESVITTRAISFESVTYKTESKKDTRLFKVDVFIKQRTIWRLYLKYAPEKSVFKKLPYCLPFNFQINVDSRTHTNVPKTEDEEPLDLRFGFWRFKSEMMGRLLSRLSVFSVMTGAFAILSVAGLKIINMYVSRSLGGVGGGGSYNVKVIM